MMFLQFFIWGGWFVTMGSFLAANLGASGAQIGVAYSTQSWGAILAPFIVGLMADRFFNAERLLSVLHLAGGALMFALARSSHFTSFYPCLLAYMILYMPTLALVNSISFRQLADPSKQFAKIRVWGTIGWIVVGLMISFGDCRSCAPAGRYSCTAVRGWRTRFAPGTSVHRGLRTQPTEGNE